MSAEARRVVVTGADPIADQLIDGFARLGVEAVALDIGSGSEADVRAAFDTLAGVDQVVHTWLAPGLLTARQFMEVSEDEWAGACERSLEAAWWVARASAAPLKASGGSLVFVVPTIGMAGGAEFTMLATVAEGLRVLAKGCGRQWGASGATANTVAAAPHHWVGSGAGDTLTRAVSLSTPAFGSAGDVADDPSPLIALLRDPQAHFLTAATLVADGGTWVGL